MIKHKFLISSLVLLLALQQNVFTQEPTLPTSDQTLNNARKEQLIQQIRDEYKKSYCQLVTEFNFKNRIGELPILPVTQTYSPTLYKMVQKLCQKMNIAMPKVFIYKDLTHKSHLACHAFTIQNNTNEPGTMCLGKKLLTSATYALDYDELETVVAHELSHLKHLHILKQEQFINFKITPTATALSIVNGYLHYLYGTKLLNHFKVQNHYLLKKHLRFLNTHSLTFFFSWLALCLVTDTLLVLQLTKKMRAQEQEADITAARITNKPVALARALNKMTRLTEQDSLKKHPIKKQLKKLANIFASHPTLFEREEYLKKTQNRND